MTQGRISTLACALLIASAALHANPTITSLELVSQQRIDRYVVEVTYKATAKSSGGAFRQVTALVGSANPATVIIEGDLTFPDIPSGGSVISTDTFVIRHDYRTPFENSFLQFRISATPVSQNGGPAANAGPDQTVAVGALVTLNGAGSSDPDGNPLTFLWSLTTAPQGSQAALLNSSTVNPTFIADRPGVYVVTLVVNDGTLSSAPDTVTISTGNSAPVANAGPDQTVITGRSVGLNGSGSSDVDGNLLTYLWTFVARPAGSAASLTAANSVSPSFTADVYGSYVVQLVVNDGTVSSTPDTVVINTSNSPPTANAGPDQTGQLTGTVQLNGSASSDTDGQPLSFGWSFVSRPNGSTAVLNAPTTVSPSFVMDRSGTYVVQLIVNDGIVSSTPDTVVITSTNSPPVANAGPDQTVNIGGVVTLNGSASSDVDGNALTYSWAIISRPAGSNAVLSNAAAVTPTFTADAGGQYVAQLVVNDGTVNSVPDTVVINTGNSPPIASAGPDQTVPVRSVVALSGAASSDVDGNALTYAWSFVSRPVGSTAVLTSTTAPMPTFTADVPGIFVVQLIVNDGIVSSAPDTVSITTTNSAPVANAGLDRTVAQGTPISLDGSASSDPEGATLTYAWSLTGRPSGSTAVLANANSATPTFTVDVTGTYVAQLIVNDGFLNSAPDTVTIDTSNVPPVANAGPDQTVPAGTTVQLNGSNSSDADGNPLTYTWSFATRPSGSTAALSNSAAASPTFVADRAGTYILQLIVNDGRVNSPPDTVVISTQNQAPVAEAGPGETIELGKTAQLDGSASSDPDSNPLTYTWSIDSAPAGSTATLSDARNSRPSFTPDVVGSYTFRLIVNDGQLDSAPDTVILTVVENSGGGTLINGNNHTGSITTRAEVDLWTFNAAAGDTVTLTLTELGPLSDFYPYMELRGPNGAVVTWSQNETVARIDRVLTLSGTYTVAVSSHDTGNDATGNYRIILSKTTGSFIVPAGDQGGPMVNGERHTGSIDVGDVDMWTFQANAGDTLTLTLTELEPLSDFYPYMELRGPNGAIVTWSQNGTVARIDRALTLSGTYTVVVSSTDSGNDATGNYRLILSKTTGAFVVPNGDHGGPMTNGERHTGSIDVGDVDMWTFEASAGDTVTLTLTELEPLTDFYPYIELRGPNGAIVTWSQNSTVARIDRALTLSGTYTVVVSSTDSGNDATGNYRLILSKTTGAFVVPNGDHGGPMTNGERHTGSIDVGDVDMWTFQANAGDTVTLTLTELEPLSDFYPYMELRGPNGAIVTWSQNSTVARIDRALTLSGTYTVVVSSTDSGNDATGNYRLILSKTTGAFVVPAGDHGGPMVNGERHTGSIDVGDVDMWTFEASAGDTLTLTLTELEPLSDFYPYMELRGPNGAVVTWSQNSTVARIDRALTLSGTYTVVVSSTDSGNDGTANYRLILSKTTGAFVVPGGDEGGALTSGTTHSGAIDTGDVDMWTFQGAAGERILLTLTELAPLTNFYPYVELRGPTGAVVTWSQGETVASIDRTLSVSGTYTVVVSTTDSGNDATGNYSLVLTRPASATAPTNQ